MLRPCVVLAAATLVALFSSTAAEWVELGGAPGTHPTITLMSDSPTETVVEMQVFGFDVEDTVIGGGRYAVISLPGERALVEQGYPALLSASSPRAFIETGRSEHPVGGDRPPGASATPLGRVF